MPNPVEDDLPNPVDDLPGLVEDDLPNPVEDDLSNPVEDDLPGLEEDGYLEFTRYYTPEMRLIEITGLETIVPRPLYGSRIIRQ